jgi:polysaccharide deacetylase 2 family uncharacterized protein YibQ
MTTNQDKESPPLRRLLVFFERRKPIVVTVLVALFLLAGYALHALFSQGPQPPLLAADNPEPGPQLRAKVAPTATIYEEDPAGSLEHAIKTVDFALLSCMAEAGMTPGDLELVGVDVHHAGAETFHFQSLTVTPSERGGFMGAFRAKLDEWAPQADLTPAGAMEWTVSLHGRPTHRIIILPPAGPPAPGTEPKVKSGARLALVIDDLGEDPVYAQALADFDFPITFAIWPLASSALDVGRIAAESGLEVIIHQPMQPKSYPETDPGPGALFIDMAKPDMLAVVRENIDALPQAVGMNNHMGSQFTEYPEGMRLVLEELARREMYFLDSVTTGRSAADEAAVDSGVRFCSRDVFLDNVKDVDAIVHQLRKAEQLALRQGSAVAIGHPYGETLTALRLWSKDRDARVELVTLGEMVRQPKKVVQR